MYRIGVDIGGTKINIGIFKDKELICSDKIAVKDVENLPLSVKEKICELCHNHGIDYDKLATCGVGIPGTVSDDGKRIIKVPNIAILSEDTARVLENQLGIPVKLVQDSRAAAWGEYLCGAAVGAKGAVVCVTLGTGIGTGIVIDGRIYSGAMGSAGELGHIPVKENGRKCGCGRTGCLEKYSAGGGLDITAKEMYGEDKNAAYLFDRAESGDANAIQAVNEAVTLLGNAMVGLVNTLSPEYLLFSGGLSSREDMYLEPLIRYIDEHCYKAERSTIIKKAALGENSPLYGAAMIPFDNTRSAALSASIMCADVLNLGDSIAEIEKAGIEYLHCDIMDNHFVPNLMLPMEMLNKLRPATNLPFDFHIMAEKPETIVEKLDLRENDIVSIHFESTVHLQKVISAVREAGARAAVAINPATPIESIREVLDQIDMVLVMTVNPGFAGQKIVPGAFDKIARTRTYLDELGYTDIKIEVDGNCSFENVPKMYRAGAEIFVVGTSSVFSKDCTVEQGTKKLLSLLMM